MVEIRPHTRQCSYESAGPFEQVHFRVDTLCDLSCFSDRENVVKCSGGKFTQRIRHSAREEYHGGVRRLLRKISGALDRCDGDFLDFFQLLFSDTEMQRESSVSSCFPRNVRVEPDKPRKVKRFEPFRHQFLKKERRCVCSTSSECGIGVVDSNVKLS